MCVDNFLFPVNKIKLCSDNIYLFVHNLKMSANNFKFLIGNQQKSIGFLIKRMTSSQPSEDNA
jgi:hypothetical protein